VCCSVLQCVAVCCSVLQCDICGLLQSLPYCLCELQRVAVYCSKLRRVTQCCSRLWIVLQSLESLQSLARYTHCNTLQHTAHTHTHLRASARDRWVITGQMHVRVRRTNTHVHLIRRTNTHVHLIRRTNTHVHLIRRTNTHVHLIRRTNTHVHLTHYNPAIAR